MSKRKTTEEFKNEVYDKFGDSIEILGEYKTNRDKILVKFKECGHEGYKAPSKILAGQRCAKCAGKRIARSKIKTTEQFKKDLTKNNINYIEVISEYKGVKYKIEVLNKKCNHVYSALPGNILRGAGCPVCHGFKDTNKFIEQINHKYPEEYEIIGEYINNKTPILVRHKCGYEWEVIPKDLMRDIRCPKCIMSKGELFISKYLEENKIDFKPQYRFKECRDVLELPFDFMVNIKGQLKLIEFDGSQHFGEKSSKYRTPKVKIHDEIKNKFCKDNNIPLLRIPYWWLRNDRIIKELDKFIFNE